MHERNVALARLSRAESEHAKERPQRVTSQIVTDRRVRYGKKMFAQKREPRAVMRLRKRSQQESAGKLRAQMADREQKARAAVDASETAVRETTVIRLDLGATAVPRGRRVLDVSADGDRWTVVPHVAVGTLDQDPWLPQDTTAFGAVRRGAPGTDPHRVRETLAGLELRGDAAQRPVPALSGGERLRVALDAVLPTEPAPQLLLLDEPTNNLDMDSVTVLVEALGDHRGALLVVSHDEDFVQRIGLRSEIDMTTLRGLTDPSASGD